MKRRRDERRPTPVLPMMIALVLMLPMGSAARGQGTRTGQVIRVEDPTGRSEIDRSAIIAALETSQPGDTVEFAPGIYVIGSVIRVTQRDITLAAHPDGTVLRGCDPAEFPSGQELARARSAGEIEPEEYGRLVGSCGVMMLTGGGVTVRGFTIEYTRLGFCLSACAGDPRNPVGDTSGGYRIEENTFRNSTNGVRGSVVSSDTSFIQNNRFLNTFHAVSFLDASNLHVRQNEISAPDPRAEPGLGHVSFAIALGGDDNVIADNRIAGHPDGILLAEGSRNVIRGNTISVARNLLPEAGSPALATSDPADSTIVGVPLALHLVLIPGLSSEPGQISENVVEGNRILGAEGVGIELTRASGNRIIDNEVIRVTRRELFPGNSVSTDPTAWREANGSGIYVSPESAENQIRNNRFEDVEGSEIVLEGDRNLVTTGETTRVRDRGAENQVARTGSGVRSRSPRTPRGTERPTSPGIPPQSEPLIGR